MTQISEFELCPVTRVWSSENRNFSNEAFFPHFFLKYIVVKITTMQSPFLYETCQKFKIEIN